MLLVCAVCWLARCDDLIIRAFSAGGPADAGLSCSQGAVELRCTVVCMEWNDPDLPGSANDWLLATSDQVQALAIQWSADPDAASMADIVDTLLALAEAQARIITTLDLRIQAIERP